MNFEQYWLDLYDRLKAAEIELEELADATNDTSEASRLISKMHGVSLARDYMRGYYDPSAAAAASPGAPETSSTTDSISSALLTSLRANTPEPDIKTVWKFVINPFTRTEMPVEAKILYVGEQGTDVCVWALVDPSVARTEHRAINAYGTGHTVDPEPGRYLGSVQMTNGENAGLVFHLFDGDDV